VSDDFLQDPQLLQDFVVESEEALQRMDQDMVALESAPNDADLLNRIFRSIHNIKGTSSFLSLDPIVKLSHRAEDVLNALRHGDCRLTRRLMDAMLGARDQLGRMLVDLRNQRLGMYPIDDLLHELELVQIPSGGPLTLGEILARIMHVFRNTKSLFMVKSCCIRSLSPRKRLSLERAYDNTMCSLPRNC
jgi:HPt (histidine-containing phosphotransfer) domain-containing protein